MVFTKKEILLPDGEKIRWELIDNLYTRPGGYGRPTFCIHTIRDRQVMLDQDLAALYGVETRRLNEQVRRNIERFPQDFMFQLSPTEFRDMRSQAATATDTDNQTIMGMSSQFATTLSRRPPLTALPYAFTEKESRGQDK